MKKRIGVLAVIGMALMLAACGGKNEETAARSKEHIFRAQPVDIEGLEDANRINNIQIVGNRMHVTTYDWNDDGGSTIRIFSRNLDGTDLKSMQMVTSDNTYYSQIIADTEGNYFSVRNDYREKGNDPEHSIWINEYYLVKLDGTGQELWKQPLTGKDPEAYWVDQMRILPDGRILISDTDGLFLYDAQGMKTGQVKLSKELDGFNMYQLRDGTVVLRSYGSEKNAEFYNRLNVDTGELSEDYSIPGNSGNYSETYVGEGYDFFLVGNGSLYGYNLGDTEPKELMNFIDSDLVSYYISSMAVVNEKEFYGVISDETGQPGLMKFTKVEPKDVKDKKILTLGCNYCNWDVRNRVVSFNKSSEEYRIVVEDYSKYNTDEDYNLGMTRLNTDIASGKVPDILILEDRMPIDSYVSKGLFEDLYPYIDKDEAMNREDFLSNVLSLYEVDGRLYRLVPGFRIYTVVGKTADVGTEPGWTLDDLKELMAGKPDGTEIFSEMTRDNMLTYGIQMSGNQFIDWKTGQCGFNTREFTDLLEFAARFPEELGDDYYNENFWRSYDSLWREGKVVLQQMYLSGFNNYNYMKKGTFGEDITLIGFPVREGNGAALAANLELAMSSKSRYKDGAWKFLRYFLTDEYQEEIDYQWPLSLRHLERLAQEAMKNPTYEDMDGNIVEEKQIYMIDGVEITITPMSREEVDEVIAYVKSIDQLYSYNQALLDIVREEAAPYFAGQKNVQEVADIIQSRAQIYVNENR